MQRQVRARMIQAKLKINEPGDAYERKADRVTEQVVQMPEPDKPRKPGCPFIEVPSRGDKGDEHMNTHRISNEQDYWSELLRTPIDEDQRLRSKEIHEQTAAVAAVNPDFTNSLKTIRRQGQEFGALPRSLAEQFSNSENSRVHVYAETDKAEPDPTGESASTIPPSPVSSSATCNVKSFQMIFNNWNTNLPSGPSGKTTIRLPVKFKLVLDSGSTRKDCRIRQFMKGRVQHRAHPALSDQFSKLRGDLDEYESWKQDGPLWWDGTQWNGGGSGTWHIFTYKETATFYDEPGFNEADQFLYPLYWGGVHRQGHFQFITDVADANLTSVRKLQWGLLIDYTSPMVGSHYFYK